MSVKRPTNEEIIEEYLSTFTSIQSVKMRKSQLNYFFEFYRGQIFDITTDILMDYFKRLKQAPDICLTTKSNKWHILTSFLEYCIEYYRKYNFIVIIPKKTNKWGNIHKLPHSNKDIFATKEEIQTILAYFKANNFKHYLIFRTLTETGMRLGELLSIKTDGVDLGKRVIHTIGKTGDKYYYISKELAKLLESYLSERKKIIEIKTDTFFINNNLKQYTNRSIQLSINDACKKANILVNITPHTFRRTLNNLRQEKGCSEEIRCILLNHSVPGVNFKHYVSKDYDKFIGYFDSWNPFKDLKL